MEYFIFLTETYMRANGKIMTKTDLVNFILHKKENYINSTSEISTIHYTKASEDTPIKINTILDIG
jgi:hypothetical protein